MKRLVKSFLYAIAPRLTTSLISARARAHSHRVIASWGCGPLNQKLVAHFGNSVQQGPFAGMVLTEMTHAEQLGPYLLGVYESELDDAWATVFRGSYSQIVDIGAKFGYYAVGLAKKYPDSKVVAFDTDWWARKAVREMVVANGVANVDVKGFCSPDWLARCVKEAAFIISDCEGYESELFETATVSKLATSTLIIETHDCFVPGVSEKLRERFGRTHLVRNYGGDSHRRDLNLFFGFLTENERNLALHEVRPHQSWLLCLPKTGPNRMLQN